MSTDIIKLPENPAILVVRTDRIGDMVLSLPVFASIRKAWPAARVTVLARDYTSQLIEGREDVDEVISFSSSGAHVPAGMILPLASRLREKKFDAAILLYLKSSVAITLALARIPVRIGPATKLAQLALTHRIPQRRSQGLKNEADYNLDLLAPLGIEPVREAKIHVDPNAPKVFQKNGGRPLVGVHPGSGGSARNWPKSNWVELIRALSRAGYDIALTGAAHERDMVEGIKEASGERAQVYIGQNGLKALAEALAQLDVFVGPSTGPLHMASAAGTPVVGIYCPIRVCLPVRWGPIGPGGSAVAPDVPPCEYCLGADCPHFDCMEKITPDMIVDQVAIKIRSATLNPRD
ncbi:MAG: glycosyltransferase family 9 protein [Nitrospinota bacterium]|nr:glycosyltransferase family 9 protein [Nitrospinota bacterium]